MQLEKKAIYIPANGIQFRNYWLKNLKFKGNDFKFFTNESIFQYRYMLDNAYYSIESGKLENYRNAFAYPKDNILIGDSGGFQIESYRKKGVALEINPIQILRWLENNCDIGMNLDIPPIENFNESLKKSLENFKLFQDNRQNYNMKLYNILHGMTIEEIETWYDAVKDFNFDGWAIGIKPSTNIYLQILGFLVLHEKKAKNLDGNIHFFGMSGLQNMIFLAMLSKHFDTAITFDSSTFNMGSRVRAYYIPNSVRHFFEFGRNANKKLKTVPCDCPVCSKINIENLYSDEPETPLLLSLHNLYQFIKMNNLINNLIEDNDVFVEFVKSLGEYEIVENVNKILEDYDKKGYRYVYEKYKYLFNERQTIDANKNLFSF